MSDEDALIQLQSLLRVNGELLEAQNKANELKEEELLLKKQELQAEQDRIDLERQNKALQREALNRAEKRLQEVLHRYAGLAERVEILITYAQKNLFKDDAFKDMLAQLSERFETFERAMMLGIMEKLDSPYVQNEARDTVGQLGSSLNVASKRRQLSSHYKNLNKLLEQQADGDDSLIISNKIDKARENIERLEQELGRTAS